MDEKRRESDVGTAQEIWVLTESMDYETYRTYLGAYSTVELAMEEARKKHTNDMYPEDPLNWVKDSEGDFACNSSSYDYEIFKDTINGEHE